jgi:hypothetical protein
MFFVIISAGPAKGNDKLESCRWNCVINNLKCNAICNSLTPDRRTPCEERCKYELHNCHRWCDFFYYQPEQPEQLGEPKKSEGKRANLNKYFFFIYLKNGNCRKFDNIKISKNSIEAHIYLPTGSSSVNYSKSKILWIVGSDYKSYFENGKLTKETKNKILNECGIGE